MIKIFLIFILSFYAFANENFINTKNCEIIKLSKFTTLISCHKIDYLVEYKPQEDEEKDNIKKITAITANDQKIILGERK